MFFLFNVVLYPNSVYTEFSGINPDIYFIFLSIDINVFPVMHGLEPATTFGILI